MDAPNLHVAHFLKKGWVDSDSIHTVLGLEFVSKPFHIPCFFSAMTNTVTYLPWEENNGWPKIVGVLFERKSQEVEWSDLLKS